MKRTKQISSKDINTDSLISELITLESKNMMKKKKRKLIIHDQDLTSDVTSPKGPKLKSKHTSVVTLVPSPIKVKSESVSRSQQSCSESDNSLPESVKIKKEKSQKTSPQSEKTRNKGIKVSNNLGSVAKQALYLKQNSSVSSSSNKEEIVSELKQIQSDIQPHSTRRSTVKVPSPMKVKLESVSRNEESSSESNNPFPEPIKIKKVENKNILSRSDKIPNKKTKVSNNPKTGAKQVSYSKLNLSANSSSDNEKPVPKRKHIETKIIQSHLTGTSSSKLISSIKVKLDSVSRYQDSNSESDNPWSEPVKIEQEENRKKLPNLSKTRNDKTEVSDLKQNIITSGSSDSDEPVPKLTQIESESHLTGRSNFEVPSPIKLKSDSVSRNQESNSGSNNQLPEPIKIKNEQVVPPKSNKLSNKRIKVPSNVKSEVKQISHKKQNLSASSSSDNEESISNFKRIEDFNNRLEDYHSFPKPKQIRSPAKRNRGRSDSSDNELDQDMNKKTSEKKVKTKDGLSQFSKQRHIENNSRTSSDFTSSKDERLSTQPNWIQTLQLKNPRLRKQIVDISLPLHANYSLIRVPKNVNPTLLRNLKCSFNKEIDVTLNNKPYVFRPLEKKPEPIFISLNGPRLVNLEKIIVLQKSVPLLPSNNIEVPERKNVPLPRAIKIRHPLFGVEYKKRISIEKTIKKKIVEATENKGKIEKRERKKKFRVKQKDTLVNQEKNILELLNLFTETVIE